LAGLPYIFPELVRLKGETQSPPHALDIWEHTLSTIKQLEWLFNIINPLHSTDQNTDELGHRVLAYLWQFQPKITAYLNGRLNPERSHMALLTLAGLYHDAGKPDTRSVEELGRIHNYRHEQVSADLVGFRGHALVLSNAEIERLQTIIRFHMRVHSLAQGELPPSRRSIYHFFRDTGGAGIDICLLSLADACATYGGNLPEDVLRSELSVITALFTAWWEKPDESVRPPGLIDGHSLMDELKLTPGPLVGMILERIREAQAAGQVRNRGEAISFARHWLEAKHQETRDETKN